MIKSKNRRKWIALLASIPLLVAALPSSVLAQSVYPNKPIRLIVPFPPGGTTDTVGRRVAQNLSQMWGQTVVVENKPGAGTTIGVDYVARANPDGYVLGLVTGSFTVNHSLMTNLPYDTEKDLRAVASLARSDHILVVNPSLGVSTVDELIDLAKKKPGELSYASFGNGSSAHLAGEMLKLEKGVDIVHVPYRGQSPAMTDLVGGQVQFMFANLPEALPLLKEGRVKAIGLAANQRSTFAPDIPTLKEQGVDIESSSWSGVIAPAGVPDEIIQKLNQDINKVLADKALQDGFSSISIITTPKSMTDFKSFLKQEMDNAQRVIQAANITLG